MVNITKQTVGFVVTTFCHMLILAFVIYVIYLNIHTTQSTSTELLRWHIVLLTIGFGALMSEAIMAVTPDNLISTKMTRKTRVLVHWVVQVIGMGCIIAGLIVVVVMKEKNNGSHFKSNHAIVGLSAIVCSCVACIGGIAALYAFEMKKIVKPVITKVLHNVVGQIAFLLGIVSLILGLYTNWFKTNSTFLGQVLCTEALIIVGLVSVYSACITAYDKFKTIFR